jgi:hypothetical protein
MVEPHFVFVDDNPAELSSDGQYLLGLVEDASRVEVGKTWLLDKLVAMLDLRTSDR